MCIRDRDSESDGGRDKDKTTLSADKEEAAFGYCYGISEYLPYGTYVTVEQLSLIHIRCV